LNIEKISVKKKKLQFLLYKAKNIGVSAYKSYVHDRLRRKTIQNDMGASFTNLVREKDKIIKRAEIKGEDKLKDEIEWNLRFKNTYFGKFLPKIYDYSLTSGDVFYKMKYYAYPNLRKIIIEDLNTSYFMQKRWRFILKVLFKKLYINVNSMESQKDFFEKHHLEKYRKRIKEASVEAPYLSPIIKSDIMYINQVKKLGPDNIISEIVQNKEIMKALVPPKLYIAHGDLHCNNIICGVSISKLIFLDSRGKSPAGNLFFDPSYDIAKLYHDLHSNYSLIEKHLFEIIQTKVKGSWHIDFAFTDNDLVEKFTSHYFYVRSIIEDLYQTGEFENINYRADFTEAMLYLTMIPLHLRSSEEGLICLATGILRLNQWLKRYHLELYNNLISKY